MNHVPIAALGAALMLLPRVASAQEADQLPPPACPAVGDVPALARCALARSEAVRHARDEVAAVRGRRVTAGHVLPANPTVDIAAGRRRTDTGRVDADRGVDVSQQIEIGGQRSARLEIIRAEEDAAVLAFDAAEREVIIDLTEAVIGVERARAGVQFAAEELELAGRLVEISGGRVKQGMGSALDEDLAEAARVQARRGSLSTAQMLRDAEAKLALVVGADVKLADGATPPQGFVPDAGLYDLERRALAHRQTVQGPLAETRAAKSRLDLLRRERTPDLTLAAVYKHEELADVFGGRLSIPLPFFHRNQGAIAEQQARIGQAEAAAGQADLRVRLEVRAAYDAWKRALAVATEIPAGMEGRLSDDAEALRNAYGRGAMPLIGVLASLRETFAARRTLVDAKADALITSFELARATASPVALIPTGGRP